MSTLGSSVISPGIYEGKEALASSPFPLGVAAFNPGSIAGLMAWYDAADTATITSNAGRVSQWNDKSGNARHLTQATGLNQPSTGIHTINSKNVISFDPTTATQVLRTGTLGGIFGTGFTIFFVFIKTGAAVTFEDPVNITASNLGTPIECQNASRFVGGNLFSGAYTNVAAQTTAALMTWQGVAAGVTFAERKNGVAVSNGSTTPWNNSATQQICAGSRSDGVTSFRGDIGEIIIYDTSISTTDRGTVETYLNGKWVLF